MDFCQECFGIILVMLSFILLCRACKHDLEVRRNFMISQTQHERALSNRVHFNSEQSCRVDVENENENIENEDACLSKYPSNAQSSMKRKIRFADEVDKDVSNLIEDSNQNNNTYEPPPYKEVSDE